MPAQRQLLADGPGGGRWHFRHGPIDIVIGAQGEAGAVEAAHAAAWLRFATILDELVGELPTLRRPVAGPCPLRGHIACHMWWACRPSHFKVLPPALA